MPNEIAPEINQLLAVLMDTMKQEKIGPLLERIHKVTKDTGLECTSFGRVVEAMREAWDA